MNRQLSLLSPASALVVLFLAAFVLLLAVFAVPAAAERQRLLVELETGEVVELDADVDPRLALEAIEVPGLPNARVVRVLVPPNRSDRRARRRIAPSQSPPRVVRREPVTRPDFRSRQRPLEVAPELVAGPSIGREPEPKPGLELGARPGAGGKPGYAPAPGRAQGPEYAPAPGREQGAEYAPAAPGEEQALSQGPALGSGPERGAPTEWPTRTDRSPRPPEHAEAAPRRGPSGNHQEAPAGPPPAPRPTRSFVPLGPVSEGLRAPVFLAPIYHAAAHHYGVPWEVLAAINSVETNYGRNLNVSSAGAMGWMQFMPGTWRAYGVDASGDGRADPYHPRDAIFAAARYLRASGAPDNLRAAIFAYNHADWYVDMVLQRAAVIAGLGPGIVDPLVAFYPGPPAAIDEPAHLPLTARHRSAPVAPTPGAGTLPVVDSGAAPASPPLPSPIPGPVDHTDDDPVPAVQMLLALIAAATMVSGPVRSTALGALRATTSSSPGGGAGAQD